MKQLLTYSIQRWKALTVLGILLLFSTSLRAQTVEVTGLALSDTTIPSCKDFILYIDYSWSDFPSTGLQSLQVAIDLPSSLEFTAASINPSYGSATGPTSAGTITFTITNDLTASSG